MAITKLYKDISDKQLLTLTNELLSQREANLRRAFGIFVIEGTSKYAPLGRHVEFTVFKQAFNCTPQEYEEKYLSHDDDSVFLLAIDHRLQLPAGVIRITHYNRRHMQESLRALTVGPWHHRNYKKQLGDLSRVVDIASWAVLPPYRNKVSNEGVSTALLHACVRYTLEHPEITTWLSVMDVKPMKLIQRYGEPFNTFPDLEQKMYIGSLCVPVYLHFEEALAKIRTTNWFAYRLLIKGNGLKHKFDLPFNYSAKRRKYSVPSGV